VITDITELKRIEEALRQSYDELRTIYECMVDGLLIADIETKGFVKANRGIGKMLGYSPEEFLSMSVQDIHPQQDLPAVLATFQSQAEGRFLRADSLPVLRRDGSVLSADITANRIVYNGRPCLIGFFRDVTERRQAEEKLKAEQRALRRMLLASDHERRLITYELHDGVAQQLLGALIYFQSQEPPKGRKSKETGTAYREGIDALRRAASELRGVMNRLRTPVLDKYGLAEAIEDLAAQLRLTPTAPEIEYRHAVKFTRLEPTLENSLFRIAQEAMANACRHSRSKKVRVQLTQKGDDVTLEVRDWGIGFDQDAVAENRFGLESIRERARILGGKLSIKSEPDQGTVVRVKFPVIEPSAED
jgi:PAS domain S-box-containing protein